MSKIKNVTILKCGLTAVKILLNESGIIEYLKYAGVK